MRRRWISHLLTLLLVVADAAAICILWPAAHKVRMIAWPWFGQPINAYDPAYLQSLVPFLVIWWAILFGFGHYAHHRRISSLNDLRRMVQASFVLFLAMPALAWFLKHFDLGRSVVLLAWLMLTLYLYLSRSALRLAKQVFIRGGGHFQTRVIIYGSGPTARDVANSIRDHREVGYKLIGFVADTAGEDLPANGESPILGKKSELARIARERGVDEVFIAEPDMHKDDLLNLVVELEEARVTVKTVTNLMEVITGEFQEEELADFPVMNLRDGHMRPSRALAKRGMDLALTVATAPAWGLLWLAIAGYLKASQGGKVHFSHERVGKDGRVFRLHKFRTMAEDAQSQAPAPGDSTDSRITPAGLWLRRTSLDELPQLFNVLKGDMSLVGPRPEMPFIVERYEPWQRRRLDVPPGLTGLWQVIGRKNLPLRYNLEYDFYYIRNQSLWLDLSIVLRTIPAVLFGKGAF